MAALGNEPRDQQGPLLTSSLLLTPEAFVALSALRWFPDTADDAFELACTSLRRAPTLDAVLAHANSLGLLHVCLRSYRSAIEADPQAREWLAANEVANVILGQQRVDLEELLIAAQRAGIDLVVPKGLAFALELYPDQPVLMADIDILVRGSELSHIIDVLDDRGYRHRMTMHRNGLERPKAALVAEVERSVPYHGQLYPHSQLRGFPALEPYRAFIAKVLPTAFVVTENGIYRPASVDVHYSLNPLSDHDPLGERPTEAFWWEGVRSISLGRTEMKVLADHVAASIVPYRLYHEIHCHGGRSLKALSDVVALVRRGRVDFDSLSEIGSRFPAVRPALYYVYRFVRDFSAGAVPDHAIDRFAKPSDATYSDWGDLLPVAFGKRALFSIHVP
jgi:hypothetical protein